MKSNSALLLILLLKLSLVNAQMSTFQYRREIKEINGIWNQVILPEEIFSKANTLSGAIRIYGINSENDTIEAPYILQINEAVSEKKEIPFELINQAKAKDVYYFTFELSYDSIIDRIKLNFTNENFDWKVTIEGSQDQKTWDHLIENYRIISIRNTLTEYSFTNVEIPKSRYRFYRLSIPCKDKPELKSALLYREHVSPGKYIKYSSTLNSANTKEKQSILEITLKNPAPISTLKLFVSTTFDFYRPIFIEYVSDSVKTPNGWIKQYTALLSSTLSTLEPAIFHFQNTITGKLRVTISNFDNIPLKIDSVQISGNMHSLITRITQPATYFLTYGTAAPSEPNYDINEFANRIPDSINVVTIGEEQLIIQPEINTGAPLFKNKAWLWVIMSVIILILGWFSLKMIKNN